MKSSRRGLHRKHYQNVLFRSITDHVQPPSASFPHTRRLTRQFRQRPPQRGISILRGLSVCGELYSTQRKAAPTQTEAAILSASRPISSRSARSSESSGRRPPPSAPADRAASTL